MRPSPIKVETVDREIAYAIWDLQSKFRIEEEMAKAFPAEVKEIFVYAKDTVEFLAALAALIQVIKPVKDKNKSTASITIQSGDNSPNVVQIIEANKGSIDIKIVNK